MTRLPIEDNIDSYNKDIDMIIKELEDIKLTPESLSVIDINNRMEITNTIAKKVKRLKAYNLRIIYNSYTLNLELEVREVEKEN